MATKDANTHPGRTPCTLLISGIGELATARGDGPRGGASLGDVTLLHDAAIACDGDRICQQKMSCYVTAGLAEEFADYAKIVRCPYGDFRRATSNDRCVAASLFATCFFLFATFFYILVTCYLLLSTCYLLPATFYMMLAIFYLLLAPCEEVLKPIPFRMRRRDA